MTKAERLAAQKYATQQAIADHQAKLRQIAAQEAAIVRRQRERRLVEVGKLVESAGLLDAPDDWLEKQLAELATRLPTESVDACGSASLGTSLRSDSSGVSQGGNGDMALAGQADGEKPLGSRSAR